MNRKSFLFFFFLSYLIFAHGAGIAREQHFVNFWSVGTHDEAAVMQKIADIFYQRSGIRVHVQPIPWGNFATKYLTAMASGDPPDAGTSNLSAPLDYGKVGGVIDLEKAYPEAISRLKGKIFPDMWPTCYFQGHLFGIPFNATALVGFYRKDIFQKLGLQPPKTWSELIHVLDVLTAHRYQYGFLWTRNAHWGIGTYIWPFGELVYEENGTKVNWTSPNFLKGYSFAINLWNSYNLIYEKPVELMSLRDPEKALPLFFDYDLRYGEIIIRSPHLKDKFGFFPFPRADDGIPATIMGGRTLVIFRDAKNPDDAMKWIEFLMSEEAQLLQYHLLANLGERSQMLLPVNQNVWQEDFAMLPGHQRLFHEVYQRLKSFPGYPWTKESDRILEQSFYKVREKLENYLKKVADAQNLSVFDLKVAFARGEFKKEKEDFQKYLQQTCREVLSASAIIAQKKLDRERRDYYKYFGKRLEKIIQSGDGWDILDYAKAIVIGIIAVFLGFIFGSRDTRKSLNSYLYIAPPVISALVFIFIPILVSLYLSFTKYNPVIPLSHAHWVGLENYILILKSPELWGSLGRSLYFALLVLPIQLFIAVILAACLDKNLIPDRLYKFMYFSPLVTSVVSVSLIWFALYAGTNYGWINSLLLKLEIVKDPVRFLKDKALFLNSVIVMSIWQGLAFAILIFLAGLQNVNKELYEASAIDGAGPVRQFFSISLPNLKPQLTFLVIMGTIGAIQVFEQIYMLGGGAGEAESKFGPDDSGMTIVPFLYRKGFEYFKMGEASAIAYLLFILLFVLTYLNLKLITRRD